MRRFRRGAVRARGVEELEAGLRGLDNLWLDLGAPAGSAPVFNGGGTAPVNFSTWTDYGDVGSVGWKPTAVVWGAKPVSWGDIAKAFSVGGFPNGSPYALSPGIGQFWAWFQSGIPPHVFPDQVSVIDPTVSRGTGDDAIAEQWLNTVQPGGVPGLLRFGCTVGNPAPFGAWNSSPDNTESVFVGPQFNVSGVPADVSAAVSQMPDAVECVEAWVPVTFDNLQVTAYEVDVKPLAAGVDGWLRYRVNGVWVEKREYAWDGSTHVLTDEGDDYTSEDLAPASSGLVSFALMGTRLDSRGPIGPGSAPSYPPVLYDNLPNHGYRTLGWGLGSTVTSGVRAMVNVKELVQGCIRRLGSSPTRDEFLWPTTGGVPPADSSSDAFRQYLNSLMGPRSLEFFGLPDNLYTWRAQASGQYTEADGLSFDGPILARFRWSDGSVDDLPVPLVYPRA